MRLEIRVKQATKRNPVQEMDRGLVRVHNRTSQAVFLMWISAASATQDVSRFYGNLTFLYLTEMPPPVIFVIMFKKASEFIKEDHNKYDPTHYRCN